MIPDGMRWCVPSSNSIRFLPLPAKFFVLLLGRQGVGNKTGPLLYDIIPEGQVYRLAGLMELIAVPERQRLCNGQKYLDGQIA